ncbi:MAG: hypothetical protein ACTSXO_06945 [Candidatus Heimdallarchaeota archaeon]
MAKKKNNPSSYFEQLSQSMAIIAEQTKIQTKILDRLENRQDRISEVLVSHDMKIQEQNKSIFLTLKNYFRLILALIAALASLVGVKIYL